MDFSEFRRHSINLLDLKKADHPYDFYYDETNNPRLFKINDTGFNVDERAFFILGGIVFDEKNKPSTENLDQLYKDMHVQQNMAEVKFRHIQHKSKGFISLMRKSKVQKLLNWLYSNNYWIHYSYQDNFYYSIVDIVDSMEESFYMGPDFLREIKNSIYLKMKKHKTTILDIFRKNDYPNIVDTKQFVADFLNWIHELDEDDDFYLEYFRQSIKGYRNKDLVFLKDNVPLITIDDYSMIYINRIVTFLYSNHTFDNEEVIEEKIKMLNIQIQNKKITNYAFVDSKSNKFVQISDLIVGIIRMWFTYLDSKDINEMTTEFSQLNPKQRETLKEFNAIMNNSLKENPTFKHGSGSNDFERKIIFFLNYDF